MRFTITLKCGELTLNDMIALGKYDSIDSDITIKRFPIGKETYEVEVELVQAPWYMNYKCYVTNKEVSAKLEWHGLRDGKIEELLALGEKFPDLQHQFPIAARGSSARSIYGNECVPILFGSNSYGRHLGFRRSGEWSDDYRFLAVRK
jgi:hypothetical protein